MPHLHDRLNWTTSILLTLTCALFVCSAHAQTISVESHPADGEIGIQFNNGVLITDSTMATGHVGKAGSNPDRYNANVIYFFRLPFPSGDCIENATLSFLYEDLIQGTNPELFNVDVWGLGFSTLLTPSLDANWTHVGDDDTNPGLGIPNRVKIQNDILTPGTDPNGNAIRISTNGAGSNNLTSFIKSLYEAGAIAGDYAVIRLNDDRINQDPTGGGTDQYVFGFQEYDSDPANRPMLDLTVSGGTGANQGRYRVVAQVGDSANGNGSFSNFFDPHLNNAGQVAFRAASIMGTNNGTSDDSGIFIVDGSTLVEIAREGSPAPDGGNHESFDGTIELNNAGHVVLGSATSIGGGEFLYNGNDLAAIALVGDSAGNGTFASFNNRRLNESGYVALRTQLSGTNNGTSDDKAIFVHDGSSLNEIVRKGDSAFGNGEIGNFSFFEFNNLGQIAFPTFLTNTDNGSADNAGIFLFNGSNLVEIVRKGDPAGSNGNFSQNFTDFEFNDSGEVAWLGSLLSNTNNGADDNSAYFIHDGSSLSEVVREGDSAPNNGAFSSFTQFNLNNSGKVAFVSSLTGTNNGSLNDNGIFCYDGSTINELVREGDSAVGNGKFGHSFSIEMNDTSQVLFRADSMTETECGDADDSGLFITDGIEVIEIRREGDLIPGTDCVISYVSFEHRIHEFGQVVQLYEVNYGDGELIELWTPDLHYRSPSHGNWVDNFNWTLSLTPGRPHNVFIDPVSMSTITGPVNDIDIRSLVVGVDYDHATLQLVNGATINATFGANIFGTLTGDGTILGSLQNSGTVIADNLYTDTYTNTALGLLQGDGSLNASVGFANFGEIRVDDSEHMRIVSPDVENSSSFGGGSIQITGGELEIENSGDALNSGLIDILTGTLRIDGPFTNEPGTGLIAGRDCVIRFNDEMINDGSIGMSFGTSDIFGKITNSPTGMIMASGGANVTFYDDVDQNGTMVVASAGASTSSVVMFGAFSGAGGFTGGGNMFALGDLRPGNSPAEVLMDGNLFLGPVTNTHIELGGLATGEFDSLIVTGDLGIGGNLSVELINGFQLNQGDSFLIVAVGGDAMGQFNGLNEGALVGNFNGVDLFITYTGGDGNDIELNTGSQVILGDVNLDGAVNLLDVDPFIAVVGSGGYQVEADCNEDGEVNLLDINPFIAILGGG